MLVDPQMNLQRAYVEAWCKLVKQIREDKGLSAKQAAKELELTGPNQVTQYETRFKFHPNKAINLATILKFCTGYGISPAEMFERLDKSVAEAATAARAEFQQVS